MEPRNFRFQLIVIIYLIISTSFGFLQTFSYIMVNTNHSYRNNTVEEWSNIILSHNNIELENLSDLPPQTISIFHEQLNIYQAWSNGFYTTEQKKTLLFNNMHTPEIRYLGPHNHPIENFDLKSHDDGKFEINFRLDDRILNEWVYRVYTYLDYNNDDTNLGNSEKFQDGSNYKHYQPGEIPLSQDLNPDVSFMGIEFDKILEDHEQWTNSEKDYNVRKDYPGRVDPEILFHVKVLYKKDIYELNGWHSYYFYCNFHISWYWTSKFQSRTLNLKDDDTEAPVISNINIINSPIYDNYEIIHFDIISEDYSGISELYIEFNGQKYFDDDYNNFISIPNPSIPGYYILNIMVIDNDTDREGDQLASTDYFGFEVFDDDTENPVISNISILNYPIYDCYNDIIFEIFVEDNSGIEDLFIDFMENRYYRDNENNQISIQNPKTPGNYFFSATAIDADKDHENDQLNSTMNSHFEVIDDDITPPQIIINEDEFGWNVSIIDNDGKMDSRSTGNYTVLDQFGEIIKTEIIFQEEIAYRISKELINPLKFRTFTLLIYATNNDNDWEGDEETSEVSSIIVTSLEDCFNYVKKQIENLKQYIKENFHSCFTFLLIKKLNLTLKKLGDAYTHVIQGDILDCLCHLIKTLGYIKMIKSITIFSHYRHCFFLENPEFIINSLNDIRNNIVLLKGISVDYIKNLKYAYQIASIEVEVLKLKDIIVEKIEFCGAKSLKRLTLWTSILVESAIFLIANDIDYNKVITCAQNLLNKAKNKVHSLLIEGKISQTTADLLIGKINQIQSEIENVK
ncbi:MAG: hypothetical protein ACFE9X_14780 [Promethearchaeota archaeon]